MTDADIARKLTHLKVKRDTGKITRWWYKRQASKIGLKQKYPRELGMMADRAARSVMDIVDEYPNSVIRINEFGDVAIVHRSTLHIITIDFTEQEPEPPYNWEPIRKIARKAMVEWLPNYPIASIARTTIYPKAYATFTVLGRATKFLEGEDDNANY